MPALEPPDNRLPLIRGRFVRDSLGGDFVEAARSERPLGMEVGLACADVEAAYARAAPSINPRGFKILLEFIGRNRDLRVAEVGYEFRNRVAG